MRGNWVWAGPPRGDFLEETASFNPGLWSEKDVDDRGGHSVWCDGMPGVDRSAPAAEFCFPTSSRESWSDAVPLSGVGGQALADTGSHRGTMWKKRPLYRALKKGQRLPLSFSLNSGSYCTPRDLCLSLVSSLTKRAEILLPSPATFFPNVTRTLLEHCCSGSSRGLSVFCAVL